MFGMPLGYYKANYHVYWYHWVLVSSSLLLTLMACYALNGQIKQKNQQRFEFQVNQLLALVQERMSKYEDALRSGVAAIESQEQGMDANRWRRFSRALRLDEAYPGINGIGVIYYLPEDQLAPYLATQRISRPDYHIHPSHRNPEYWPITYIEPIAVNREALGLDIAFESNRLSAAKKARDSGQTQITAPIFLVQDEQSTPGFLQFFPFYEGAELNTDEQRRAHFVGHVYAPFIMHKLMEGTLQKDKRKLLFSVHDGKHELYNELNHQNQGYDPAPLFTKQLTIEMYGRPWRFNIQTAHAFRENDKAYLSLLILTAAIFTVFLALAIFILTSKSRRKTEAVQRVMSERLRSSETYFRHIIESAPCGIVMIDSDGKIELVNRQIEVMFAYDKRRLIGQNIEALVPTRFHHQHIDYRKSFFKNASARQMGKGQAVYGLRKDGIEFPAEIGLSQLDSEGEYKVLACIVDISEYVKVTNELKRSNKELNDFAYVASHDLKAPLRGIVQLAEWIEEDAGQYLGEESRRHFELLKNRTARLEKLLDDLLTYSRIERRESDIREFNVQSMVEDIFELLDPPKNFSLVCESPLPVLATLVVPLEQIFRNLINNAIKHHDKDHAVITVSARETAQGYEFAVSDDGPGILPEYHQRVFDIFQTLKPRDEVEGSGMGLAIIKKILDRYGERITIDAGSGRGCCFRFTWAKRGA
jgi:hypothetical protein